MPYRYLELLDAAIRTINTNNVSDNVVKEWGDKFLEQKKEKEQLEKEVNLMKAQMAVLLKNSQLNPELSDQPEKNVIMQTKKRGDN